MHSYAINDGVELPSPKYRQAVKNDVKLPRPKSRQAVKYEAKLPRSKHRTGPDVAELPRLTYSYTIQHADEAGRSGHGLLNPRCPMSGMWSTTYDQSEVMSFAPQQSAMQTPQAPGGQRGKPTAGRRSPRPDRHVLFTDDAQGRKKQEPVPIFGGKPIATNENGDL